MRRRLLYSPKDERFGPIDTPPVPLSARLTFHLLLRSHDASPWMTSFDDRQLAVVSVEVTYMLLKIRKEVLHGNYLVRPMPLEQYFRHLPRFGLQFADR